MVALGVWPVIEVASGDGRTWSEPAFAANVAVYVAAGKKDPTLYPY